MRRNIRKIIRLTIGIILLSLYLNWPSGLNLTIPIRQKPDFLIQCSKSEQTSNIQLPNSNISIINSWLSPASIYRVECCGWDRQQSRLPNLSLLNWPVEKYSPVPLGKFSDIFKPLPPAFDPVMSRGQRNLSRKLLHTFAKIMFDNGMGDQFMLIGGTLLGTYRHHDFIPWDDDMDVFVNFSVRHKVRRLLQQLSPEFELQLHNLDKFYSKLMQPSQDDLDLELSRPKLSWGWPFLDVIYFESNGSHLLQFNNGRISHIILPINLIYPLLFRPFGKEWYPTPRDIYGVIDFDLGNPEYCIKNPHSHIFEKRGPTGSRLCNDFRDRYAFVERKPIACSAVDGYEMLLVKEDLVEQTESGQKIVSHSVIVPMEADSNG